MTDRLSSHDGGDPDADGRRARTPRLPRVLVALVAVALLARLVGLGGRVAHFDEARVAFWTLRYAETGEWSYFPYHHGPFLFHVNAALFDAFGPSDFVMRLPVALVGGLLPAAAWLYRDRLAPDETLSLALILAANPLTLYYSRFSRNDLLLVAFALTALGFGLRALSTGRARYVAAAAVALGLGFTTKENALLYLACWAAAAGAVWAVRRRDPGTAAVPRRLRRRVPRLAAAAVASLPLALAVVVVAYAPRGGDGPKFADLWLLDPGATAAAVRAATLVPAGELVAVWVAGNATQPLGYVGHLALFLGLLVVGAPAVLSLAAVGLRGDRAGPGAPRPRPLLLFAAVWAALSVVGYPYASDLVAGWTVLHAVAPLSIPAAVGLAALVRRAWGDGSGDAADGTGSDADADGRATATPDADPARARRTLVALGGAAAVVVVLGVFAAPAATFNPLGQPVQPSNDLRTTVDAVRDAAAENEGVDVAYYGEFYRDNWAYRLPLPWYFARADAEVTTVTSPAELGDDPPPVVIALDGDAAAVEPRLDGYDCRVHELAPWAVHAEDDRFAETHVYLRSPVGSPNTTCDAADDRLYDRVVRAILGGRT